MVEKTFQMTADGLAKLEQELENLKLVKRPEVIERIKIARGYGDLSENSEYEAAKDEQAFIEGRVSTVETMIRYAEIVDSASVAKDEVSLGKTVTFQEIGEKDTETYTIVGTAEADPFTGKISNESPIARSLIGRKIGETVVIPLPVGEMKVTIVGVE
ncbi:MULTISPECIES: transcription elongation factor GreA [unclassified Lactococcus]|uniref:transcription elongation factor GreA n=1 Tax=unclassified Lactococcus TaxID=2643510 RepID=UPI0011C76C70|nr:MULTISPECIES: transcription elongation factor GreA [unclassified Lactococcus]MQW22419.1 transcription elongation factor GreA [Lactococcus sp. dk101]TXK45452.1 transcription elongation factor GreA [Lactococcus sp. dk310]TXK51785.1 transcription elongation factor GreA [Lactococcus sp. dk322]